MNNPYLTAVVIGGLFFLAGQYVASQPLRTQQEAQANREITVLGTGEVAAKPDVATVNLAVQTATLPTAAAASTDLANTFQKVLAAVKAAGVADADVQTTNLSVSPQYNFTNGQQTQTGYQASESIMVKVRKLDTVSDVLAKATAQGVNQVGGINFTIDKPDDLQFQAQSKAIDNSKTKAQKLASALDVTLGPVKTFSADNGGQPGPIMYAADKASGGAVPVAGPPVAPGENTVSATVNVTYELK
jgi:uncharacterized protein YggE